MFIYQDAETIDHHFTDIISRQQLLPSPPYAIIEYASVSEHLFSRIKE